MVAIPDGVDTRLEFRLRGDVDDVPAGRCWLVGNSHTFRGRMAAWHESGYEFSVSKKEIEWLSDGAALWLDGYLAGSEPPPPSHGTDMQEEQWDQRRRRYRQTGDGQDTQS